MPAKAKSELEKDTAAKAKAELEKNMAAYHEMREKLIAEYNGKIAIFSDGKLINVFNDFSDAYKFGIYVFGEGKFSIREIRDKPLCLGSMGRFLKPCTS